MKSSESYRCTQTNNIKQISILRHAAPSCLAGDDGRWMAVPGAGARGRRVDYNLTVTDLRAWEID